MITNRSLSVATILLAFSATANAQFTPAQGSPLPVSAEPISVAVGDFRADGRMDIAIANQGHNTVTVLEYNTSGASNADFPVVGSPKSVVAADFNGDGRADLALAIPLDGAVTVLLANQLGGFTAAPGRLLAEGSIPTSLAVGDFNGDGKADLAVADYYNNSITLLLGDGTGQFTTAPGSPFTVGNLPLFLAAGDFNGDGKLDLAVPNNGDSTVTVLLGDGTGRFAAAPGSPFPVGNSPTFVVVGDFNGDGKLDLGTANYGDNSVTVLLGNGVGGFRPAPGSPFGAGTNPGSVAVGDFNGDGKLDLAVANRGDNTITELLGDGTGGFTAAPESPIPVGTDPSSVTVLDFNGDGKPDLVTANSGSNNVTVLLNTTQDGWNWLDASGQRRATGEARSVSK